MTIQSEENKISRKTTIITLSINSKLKKPKDCIYDDTQTHNNGEKILLHAKHTFILMGTPESELFIDPDGYGGVDNDGGGGDNVVNDFDLDFNMSSSEWKEHFVNRKNLLKFTTSTEVHIMNPPRKGKKLMVLDLDHTLLDFSSKKIVNTAANNTASSTSIANNNTTLTTQETINQMKRPYMDEFLAQMYQHYDLVVWSQTSWRWLETKLVELGMLTNPNYRFCFVLDKTSMFAITSTKKNGQKIKHYVKPLQIIWSKFQNVWDATNTIHLDDLSRNFALNIENGMKVSAYYRKKRKNKKTIDSGGNRVITSIGSKDVELIGLIGYCTKLAQEVDDFRNVEFKYWKDVVNGTRELLSTTSISSTSAGIDKQSSSKK